MELDNDVEITILFPTYIEKLRSLLAETPERTLGKLSDAFKIFPFQLKY